MILTSEMYVPAIRWRMGEYQALFRLSESVKNRIVPFITIPELEFDFEEWKPKKTVQAHVAPFAVRYQSKWGDRPAWVAVHSSISDQLMDDGRDIMSYVFDSLRKIKSNAIPAIRLTSDAASLKAVGSIIKADGRGGAISIRLEDLMKPGLASQIDLLMGTLGLQETETDLILDLGAPNFEPYQEFADALVAALNKVTNLGLFRNFVLIGTAIPQTFKDVGKGMENLPRHEFLFYRVFVGKLPSGHRRPNFGDYTLVHPKFSPLDMRKIKSAGKIVYTTSSSWLVSKGGAFRDNPEQMHDHCAAIVGAGVFKGGAYSSGDKYIAACAVKKAKPSNLTWWKFVTINHHITLALDDLSTIGASA